VFWEEPQKGIALSLEPEEAKGWPKVIAHGHIKGKESSTRLVLSNQCHPMPESRVSSSPNLNTTSRGPMSVLTS
jgi:hypothetical protein